MKKLFILFFLLISSFLASFAENQVYIVYVGEHSGDNALHEIEDTHHSYLLSVKNSKEEAKSSLVYSYKHSINGFAALLNPNEASKLSEMEEVVSIWPSDPNKYKMHTTRSWEFAGLVQEETSTWNYKPSFNEGQHLLSRAGYGKQVIVGLLDSGVWPESKSFNGEGMGPIPETWKGICQTGPGFNSSHCNRKIIGARYYIKGYEQRYGQLNTSIDYRSPRDKDGHGTHTASTVGGRRVHNVSALGGFGRGTASGGAPLVHLAIYKVCWAISNHSKVEGNVCFEEDMLAAIDDAIADGVNILSISIGTSKTLNYTEDGIALGSLKAIKKNIVVACSAGNLGPTPSTLSNPAPWILTVGASSVDRAFLATIVLGNDMIIEGESVTSSKLKDDKMYPLVYAADVVKPDVSKNKTDQCLPGSLIAEKVKGKIVLCMRGTGTRIGKGLEVKNAGGVGLLLGNNQSNGNDISCDSHLLPASAVSYNNAIKIIQYIKNTFNPIANIKRAKTVLHTKPAPAMTSFTSRGPNFIDPYILKPDITAPGLNILAAWSEEDAPTKLEIDKRVAKYNFLSGTSMSCPHVAAAAALLKAIHPTWSSAAIRSALMTTAGVLNNIGMPINDEAGNIATPFAYGSGHFRPTKAADPGLVYDASYTDYLLYLCSFGVKNFDPTFKCPTTPVLALNLNYPSLAIPKLKDTVTVTRIVTNVGDQISTYSFKSKPPLGVSVEATPSILFFDHVGQRKSFNITVKVLSKMVNKQDKDEYRFGEYTWTDGIHIVRSPIAVCLDSFMD